MGSDTRVVLFAVLDDTLHVLFAVRRGTCCRHLQTDNVLFTVVMGPNLLPTATSLPRHPCVLPTPTQPPLPSPRPHVPQMDFDFCQKLLKEEEERDEEETSALMGRGRREPFWSSGPGTGADRVAKRPRTDVDPSAAPTLASLTALGLNPLVDVYRDASYEQVSQWVQEFLQCDDRVPATVRHLMGLHFSVRDRQALAEMRGEGRGGAEEGEGSGGEEAQMGALLAGLHRREAVAVGSSQALPLVKYG